jgi:short subunit dehydrogenase-like uncharacterized protein
MIQVAMQSLVLGATGIVGGLITQSLALQGEKPFVALAPVLRPGFETLG